LREVVESRDEAGLEVKRSKLDEH